MYAWIHQHVIGHHSYTNIDGADPDIVTAAQVGGYCVAARVLIAAFAHHVHVSECYVVSRVHVSVTRHHGITCACKC